MDLLLDLRPEAGRSKRARLEAALRDAVRSGRLAPGTRLPATRSLCSELGVSRGVVVDAYAQLAAEGYLETRRGGGTTVAPFAEGPTGPRTEQRGDRRTRYDLNPFTPAVAEFPRALWAGALGQVVRSVPDERLGLPDPAGMDELRIALAAYLARVRGVQADPDRILITSGTRHGMGLVWATLARRGGGRVAVEQPGWPGAEETACDAGLRTSPVRVDGQGLVASDLDPGAIAVAVAPAHQYPTGAVLSAERRLQLIAWAQDAGRLIVEDDYDAEYRYDRQPIGCLQGLAPEHVIYAGSTSKTMSPALRLGWLVTPAWITGAIHETARRHGGTPSPILQLAMAQILARGDLDRHLRRQRRRYQQRRAALLDALASRLPELPVTGVSAGLFVLLELPPGAAAADITAQALAHGIGLGPAVSTGGRGAIALGYANLSTTSASRAIDLLAGIIERAGSAIAARA